MGGGKKNKRGSIPSTTSASKTELIERTPENDYGVLSDPEENEPSSSVHISTEAPDTNEAATEPTEAAMEVADSKLEQYQNADVYSHIQTEPTHMSHVSPNSPPSLQSSSQPQHPLLESQISQDQSSKSLSTLKLKLTTDKNYSKKITLHTFFSYVILAIEIERTSSNTFQDISVHNVERLVEYIIDHHSATDDIKKYLHTLFENNVVKNLISAVIDFNKDESDTLDKLLSAEQIELEMIEPGVSPTTTAAAAAAATATIIPIVIMETNAPQSSSRSCCFFSIIRRFFSRCCG
jgi:hypothetical protein